MIFWLIILLVLVVAFWAQSMRAHETAMAVARRACERDSLQLLDDTVALSRLRPQRDDDGRLRLRRTYSFEFAVDGDRRGGWVELLGGRPVALHIEAAQGMLHEQTPTEREEP